MRENQLVTLSLDCRFIKMRIASSELLAKVMSTNSYPCKKQESCKIWTDKKAIAKCNSRKAVKPPMPITGAIIKMLKAENAEIIKNNKLLTLKKSHIKDRKNGLLRL